MRCSVSSAPSYKVPECRRDAHQILNFLRARAGDVLAEPRSFEPSMRIIDGMRTSRPPGPARPPPRLTVNAAAKFDRVNW